MNLSQLRLVLNVLILLLAGQQSFARVDYSKTQKMVLPERLETSDDSATVNAILPHSDLSGRSESHVAKQILDNSLRLIWRTSPLRFSSVGQVANKVEKSVQVEKVVQSVEDNQVQHKFSFDVQGIQVLAQLKYTGWVKAAVKYNVRDASASAEVSEKIFDDKDLTFSQTVSSYDATSQVSLSWGW